MIELYSVMKTVGLFFVYRVNRNKLFPLCTTKKLRITRIFPKLCFVYLYSDILFTRSIIQITLKQYFFRLIDINLQNYSTKNHSFLSHFLKGTRQIM